MSATDYLSAIKWGTGNGKETTATIGTARVDVREPPSVNHISGLQITRYGEVLLAMTDYFAGGQRVRMLATTSNQFGTGEYGLHVFSDGAVDSRIKAQVKVNNVDTYVDVPAAAVSTKGDLLVYTGTRWAKVAAGSNNDVLTADSAQTAGVKWTASSGGTPLIDFLVGDPDQAAITYAAGTSYIYTPLYATSLTIDAGATVIALAPIFIKGGDITVNGTLTGFDTTSGQSGGTGAVGTGAAGTSVSGGTIFGGKGGSGGLGGTGSAGAGGAGGSTANVVPWEVRSLLALVTSVLSTGATPLMAATRMGAGGGSGAGDGANSGGNGGAGGAGSGNLTIVTDGDVLGTGTISSLGGNGVNGAAAGAGNAGGGAGGGGGGGGFGVIIAGSIGGGLTFSAAGGTGGTGGAGSGTGTAGANGSAGTAGQIVHINSLTAVVTDLA